MAEAEVAPAEAPPVATESRSTTTNRLRELKTQLMLESSEASDSDERNNSRSPPPNCAICLGKCRNKCFTDSCLHQFCFECLMEWSNIKAECPLCKQNFKSIIHNVKSIDQFDEYLVHPQIHHNTSTEATLTDFLLGAIPRFRYSTTIQVRPQQREAIHQLFLHNSALTERYSREYASDQIPYRQHGQEWRRYIYERRLYALPLPDVTGRLRDCSLQYYRLNEAQTHRIIPWVNRELIALLCGDAYLIDLIMDYLPSLLLRSDITSPDFYNFFDEHCRYRTRHFIHELLNFAKSPYDMIGYDREVRYSPYFEDIPDEIIVSDSSISDSEAEISLLLNSNNAVVQRNTRSSRSNRNAATAPDTNRNTQFTIETRTPTSTIYMTGSISPYNFHQRSSDNQNTNTVSPVSEISAATPNRSQAATATTNTTSTITNINTTNNSNSNSNTAIIVDDNSTIENIVLCSDSNSDTDSECQFVLARKPPHLRTPELVSLNSDSDSDVVFVDEEVLSPSNTDAISNSNINWKKSIITRNNSKLIPTPGIFEPSINTEDSLNSADDLKITLVKQQSMDLLDMNLPSTSRGENRLLNLDCEKYYIKKKTRQRKQCLMMSSDLDSSSTASESSHEEFKVNVSASKKKRKMSGRKRSTAKTAKKRTKKAAKLADNSDPLKHETNELPCDEYTKDTDVEDTDEICPIKFESIYDNSTDDSD